MKSMSLAAPLHPHCLHSFESHLNYCLFPYKPPIAPNINSLAQVNFLLTSFHDHGLLDEGNALIGKLIQFLGPHKVVFGIKQLEDDFCWEFYIYDYALQDRRFQADEVLRALNLVFASDLQVSSLMPYFMFSFQISPQQLRAAEPLESVDLYFGYPGGTLFGGKSYTLSSQNVLRFKNVYSFYDAQSDRDSIKQAVNNGAYLAGRLDIADLLLETQYSLCDVICISSKASNDCIYYSGLNIHRLTAFLRQFNYSSSLLAIAETYCDRFNHLLFDIGVDYIVTNQQLSFVKTSFYGVF